MLTLRALQIYILLSRVALVAQRPIVVKLFRGRSVGRSVRLSVCPVHCGKTEDRIRMPFGIVGRTGPWMRQVVGFGDRSTRMGTFGGEFGARHCIQWGLYGVHVCATVPRRGSLLKLLWANFLLVWLNLNCTGSQTAMQEVRRVVMKNWGSNDVL